MSRTAFHQTSRLHIKVEALRVFYEHKAQQGRWRLTSACLEELLQRWVLFRHDWCPAFKLASTPNTSSLMYSISDRWFGQTNGRRGRQRFRCVDGLNESLCA